MDPACDDDPKEGKFQVRVTRKVMGNKTVNTIHGAAIFGMLQTLPKDIVMLEEVQKGKINK